MPDVPTSAALAVSRRIWAFVQAAADPASIWIPDQPQAEMCEIDAELRALLDAARAEGALAEQAWCLTAFDFYYAPDDAWAMRCRELMTRAPHA